MSPQKQIMLKTNLNTYNNHPYHPGGNGFTRLLWHYINGLIFKTSLFPMYSLKVVLLRAFGAKVGKGVAIKTNVNIKYPWNLAIGDYVWIGEEVWIDSLVMVTIGDNVCLSQGATILTGSHNYKIPSFDLITGPVILEQGAWIGAKAVVNQGTTVGSHAVLTTGSVATKKLEAYSVYQGNPAFKVRERVII